MLMFVQMVVGRPRLCKQEESLLQDLVARSRHLRLLRLHTVSTTMMAMMGPIGLQNASFVDRGLRSEGLLLVFQVTTDSLLKLISLSCPHLALLDISFSRAVTDVGIEKVTSHHASRFDKLSHSGIEAR